MFDRFQEEIQNQIAKLNSLKEVVEYLQGELDRLVKEREQLLQELDKFNVNIDALQETVRVATAILLEEATLAVQQTQEFDLPIFMSRLEQAIRDERTIEIILSDRGLEVKIRLDLTAGTLEDYGRAIEKTRQVLRIGKIRDPYLASHMWEEKYYKPARQGTTVVPPNPKRRNRTAEYIRDYWKTITTRIANFSSLAPFWKIIDSGIVSLSSDRGGYPFPYIQPTHFVEKARNRIISHYNQVISDRAQSIERYFATLDQIEARIEYIRSLLASYQAGPSTQTVIREEVERRLGSKFPLADPAKVEQLIQDLINQVQIQERVSLSLKGTGVEVRMRTKRLQRIARS